MKNSILNKKYALPLLLVGLLSGCRAEISTDGPAPEVAVSEVSYKASCRKLIKATPQSNKVEEPDTDTAIEAAKIALKENLQPEEVLLDVSYTLVEYIDGSRGVSCLIDDGSREYDGESSFDGTKYNPNNRCDITYDLDSPTHGGFTFEYGADDAWINYYDEDGNYSFNIRFRAKECVEVSL